VKLPSVQVGIWAPSWGQPCGIAEYARHLAAELHGVAIAGLPTGLARADVVHVQHEDWLLDDDGLAAWISGLQSPRPAIAITEHSPAAALRPWDQLVSVRVALSAPGATLQRARSPVATVVLPHGCPTWFPPRKRARGRTIAAFGFLEEYKGFFALLDVLRALPDTELIMFSHAKYAAIEARWEAQSRGLPVRRARDFLPIEDVARALAAEADAIVFWYAPCVVPSVSGAVRVALATGVPVLASPTAWFADVRDETYQPADLVNGVARLLDDTALRDALCARARDFCERQSWRNVAVAHERLWRELTA
jgi:glycosyltransferase involved in cell wall biosynthesis